MTIWKRGRPSKTRKAWRRRKPDRAETERRYAAKIYLCRGSFVDIHGNEYLAGGDMAIRHDAILFRDNFRCVECRSDRNLQVHHIVTRGAGGSDNVENLRTLCHTCHKSHHVQVGGRSQKEMFA